MAKTILTMNQRELYHTQRDILDSIFSEPAYARHQKKTEPIPWLAIVGEAGGSAAPPKQRAGKSAAPKTAKPDPRAMPTNPNHLEIFQRFLKAVLEHGGKGLGALFDRLGVGVERGNEILRELGRLEYVIVSKVSPTGSKGGRPKYVPSVTQAGNEFLKAYESRNRRSQKQESGDLFEAS